MAKISSFLFLIIALLGFFSVSKAYAEADKLEYVRFTSLKGEAVFSNTSSRRNNFNNDRGSYYNAPDAWKKAFLQPFWNDGYYAPKIGHVAKVITSNRDLEAPDRHPYRLVLRVANNLIMYPPSSFEKASQSDYEEFLRNRNELGREFFGFRLNVDTIDEIKSSLKSKGIEIDRTYISKDNLNSTNIEISKGSIIPNLWGFYANKMIFSFVDDRLSSIGFSISAETAKKMYAASNAERRHFSDLIPNIIEGKYDVRDAPTRGGPDNYSYFFPNFESYTKHFWVSTNTVIALHEKPNSRPSKLELVVEYHHIPNYSKLSRERAAIKERAEEQKAKAEAQGALRKKKDLESQI